MVSDFGALRPQSETPETSVKKECGEPPNPDSFRRDKPGSKRRRVVSTVDQAES